MSDETTIRPALSAEEWMAGAKALPPASLSTVFLSSPKDGGRHFGVRAHDTWRGERYTGAILASPAAMDATIALANAALPDDDPRKITREWVRFLESEAGEWRARYGPAFGPNESADRLEQMAAALASYLPHEQHLRDAL